MRRTTMAILLGLTPASLPAQEAMPADAQVQAQDTSADMLPPDNGGDVGDRGGLSSRGGTSINGQRSFQEVIGTEIYTPIGTAMGAQVRTPPQGE